MYFSDVRKYRAHSKHIDPSEKVLFIWKCLLSAFLMVLMPSCGFCYARKCGLCWWLVGGKIQDEKKKLLSGVMTDRVEPRRTQQQKHHLLTLYSTSSLSKHEDPIRSSNWLISSVSLVHCVDKLWFKESLNITNTKMVGPSRGGLKWRKGPEASVLLHVSCWILKRGSSTSSLEPRTPPNHTHILKFNARPTIPATAQALKEVGPLLSSPCPTQKQKVWWQNMLARTSCRLGHLLRTESSRVSNTVDLCT